MFPVLSAGTSVIDGFLELENGSWFVLPVG